MTATATTNAEETITYLRDQIATGEHWYRALLRAMARWSQAEETIDERTYRYLIGGEAFDWLLLAERLIDAVDPALFPTEDATRTLLFHGHPPLEIDDEEFQTLVGTPKYQAYLNYLYGVVVEEALQLAVEEEVAKEHHAHVWSGAAADGLMAFERLYGHPQAELLAEFQKEQNREDTDTIDLSELKEFTYWLFKYRVRNHEGARVASDTRKGLATLSRVENAFRKRVFPDDPTPIGPVPIDVVARRLE